MDSQWQLDAPTIRRKCIFDGAELGSTECKIVDWR